MTDLPTIKVPHPNPDPEDWVLKLHIYWGDGSTERTATLEDVRAVLEAAGYLVAKKADFKFDVRPFSFAQPATEDPDDVAKEEHVFESEVRRALEETTERMRDLALSVRVGLAKLDWGVIKEGLLAYDGIKIGGISHQAECRGGHMRDLRFANETIEMMAAEMHRLRCESNAMRVVVEAARYVSTQNAGTDGECWRQMRDALVALSRLKASQLDGATGGAALLQQKLEEAATIASDAIKALVLVGEGEAADALISRMQKL